MIPTENDPTEESTSTDIPLKPSEQSNNEQFYNTPNLEEL